MVYRAAVVSVIAFTVPGLDTADFPVSPAQAAYTVIGEPFTIPDYWADLLATVSQDQSRLNLSGVCIDLTAGADGFSEGGVISKMTRLVPCSPFFRKLS